MEAFPTWTIGIIMAFYYVGYSAAPLVSRFVIGRAGHVKVMFIGVLLAGGVIALHALLVAPLAWAALRMLSGFVLSSAYVAAESWIHDRVENSQRGRVFSIYMVVQMAAMTIAQLLLDVGDPRSTMPFFLAAAIFVVGAFPPLFATRVQHHVARRPRRATSGTWALQPREVPSRRSAPASRGRSSSPSDRSTPRRVASTSIKSASSWRWP